MRDVPAPNWENEAMSKSKKQQVEDTGEVRWYSKLPAPSAETFTLTVTLPRFRYVPLFKGAAGYAEVDMARITEEGKLKVAEKGTDRWLRDGLTGSDELKGKGVNPHDAAREFALRKIAMLYGEEVLRERGDTVPPIVDATRRVLWKALQGAGVKVKDVPAMGKTVESAWNAALKAHPALASEREDLEARAEVIADALDLPSVQVG